jgi:hypothetical protein
VPTPHQGLSLSSVPPGSIPPHDPLPAYPGTGATGPSWHTPNTSYASITVSAPRPNNTAWLAVGAVALVVVALGAGVGVGWKSRGAGNAARVAATDRSPSAPKTEGPRAALPPVVAPSAAATSNEPPSVSVDSLPGANGAAKPLARGAGRLLVTASPGWCALSIDGKDRGPTPLAGVDLPAGTHLLRCEAPGGKLKTTSIAIQDGATSRYKFALDE